MPVYNEEEIIEEVVRQWYSQVVDKIDGSEFIIVNDGSTDYTFDILQRLKPEFPYLRIISFQHNSGHGKAVREGFSQAKNALIFQLDSDNQFRADDFWKLHCLIENNDIVLGFRNPRRDRLHRRVISLLLRFVNAAIFGIWIKDINCPFKLIRINVLGDVVKEVPETCIFFPILMLIVAKRKKYRIAEVRVSHYARKTGKGTLINVALIKGCFFCLKDILKLKSSLLVKGLLKEQV